MPKLTKEETISALEAAILKHEGNKVSIEQKGSWYKIDGGKSLRFSELEAMLESFGSESSAKATTATAKKAEPKQKAQPKAKAVAEKNENKASGKLPKELWLERLISIGGTFTLPRGYRL
ncbi:MAG: hypothetical protein ACPGUD_08860 [Parashewanella sp.]